MKNRWEPWDLGRRLNCIRSRQVEGLANRITEVPSASELASSLETPMDTTASGEEENEPEIQEAPSNSTASLGGLRRQPSVERKFNFDFLTNPRQKA
ncbi:hypothetical protein ACTXT7_016483, partial [Hymenolepis weldensis]